MVALPSICPTPDTLLGGLDVDLEQHIDGCAACRQLVSELARTSADAPSFGRYRLDTVIGSGGMGIVYRAWDPELERAVAIKLVKRAEDPGAGPRLAREAQSLARLSHSHVCQVYDVGSDGDEVWVAMELIEGTTLRAWVSDRPRAASIELLLAAADGLAAAHAAGVIHRDVKPENVLVTRDGRAVVTDFGLARIDAAAAPQGGDPGTSALGGTPAYLAPEQLARGPIDARVDQFAWAVMAWELLVGAQPFPIDAAARAEALRTGLEPPRGLPRAVGRALVRALSADPAARFPTMTALLASVRGAKRRARAIRRYVPLAVLVLALGGVALAARDRDDPEAACERGAARIDRVWNSQRADAVRRAFAATHQPFAADTTDRVVAILDTFRASFTTDATDACRATFSRGQASHQAFDLRKTCLDHGLERLDQLVTLFERADADIVVNAVNAAYAVSDLEACRDVNRLLARQEEPADPRVRARLAELRTKLARAEALDDAGERKQSLAVARELEPAADAIGYAPLRGEIALHLGTELYQLGIRDEAEAALQRAVVAAEAGRDDRLAALALIQLATAPREIGDESLRQIEQASGKLERIGNPPDLVAVYLANKAIVERQRGVLVAARADGEHAVAVLEHLGGQQVRLATVLTQLANVYGLLGLLDLQQHTAERALAVAEQIRGPHHPLTAYALSALGAAQGASGLHVQAIATLERALAIWRASNGDESIQVAGVLNDLANELADSGDNAGAEAKLNQALAIRTKLFGSDHPSAIVIERSLGVLLSETRPKDALPRLEHVLAATIRARGPDGMDAGLAYLALGTTQTTVGQLAAARANLTEARRIYIAKLGPDHARVASVWSALGELELVSHHSSAAAAALEHAIAIDDQGQRDPSEVAEDRFMLARALWPTDKHRAHVLASAARDVLAGAEGDDKQRTEIDAWLAEHAK